MGFKYKTFILWKRTKIFCNPRFGVTNNMLYALSHKDTFRYLSWSFFATVTLNSQPYILDVSMVPICFLLPCNCCVAIAFKPNYLWLNEGKLNTLIILMKLIHFGFFFTLLKTENRWLSNVFRCYRNRTFSENGLKVFIEIMFVPFSELLKVCSTLENNKL